MIISGRRPPSRSWSTSSTYNESRGVPATTFPPSPAAWSLIMLSQVALPRRPKYFGFGRAYTEGTGTTNRIPSTEATRPPPQACASGMDSWAAISAAFAAR